MGLCHARSGRLPSISMRDRVLLIPLTDAINPVEGAHGGGGRRAADYGRASGSSTSGTINTGQEAANTIDSAVLPSSLFLMSGR